MIGGNIKLEDNIKLEMGRVEPIPHYNSRTISAFRDSLFVPRNTP